MSIYPSLEDMKVDHLIQAQTAVLSSEVVSQKQSAQTPMSPLLYPKTSAQPGTGGFYPRLAEFMGMELSEEVI